MIKKFGSVCNEPNKFTLDTLLTHKYTKSSSTSQSILKNAHKNNHSEMNVISPFY